MKRTKTQKGITLVALVITIIVLLILAVVAIGAVRDSGIIGHAQNSADKYNTEKNKEESMLGKYEEDISKYYHGNGNVDNNKYYDISFKDLTKISDWETLIPRLENDMQYMLWFKDKDGKVGVIGACSYGGNDGYSIDYSPVMDYNNDVTYYTYTHGDKYNEDKNDIWLIENPDGPNKETNAPEIKNVRFMTEDAIQEYCMNNMEFDEDEKIDENFKFKGNMYFDMTEEQKEQILNITEAGNLSTDEEKVEGKDLYITYEGDLVDVDGNAIQEKVELADWLYNNEYGEILCYIGDDENLTISSTSIVANKFEIVETGEGSALYKINKDKETINITENIMIYFTFLNKYKNILKSVNLNNIPVRFAVAQAFDGATSLTTVTGLAGLRGEISDYTFRNCYNLKELEFPEGVTLDIGVRPFYNSGIEKIILPSTISDIGAFSFENCPNLKEIVINKSQEECTSQFGASWNNNIPVTYLK